jgi:hypothetical protein
MCINVNEQIRNPGTRLMSYQIDSCGQTKFTYQGTNSAHEKATSPPDVHSRTVSLLTTLTRSVIAREHEAVQQLESRKLRNHFNVRPSELER